MKLVYTSIENYLLQNAFIKFTFCGYITKIASSKKKFINFARTMSS